MNKFFVIGLTNDEIADRTISQIMDTIRRKSFETGQLVIKKELLNPKENLSEVYFENVLTNPDMEENGFYEILYVNDAAMNLIQNIPGLKLNVIKEVETVHENAGVAIRMSYWS